MIKYNAELVRNGDYVPAADGSLALDDYVNVILQDIARAVSTGRGSFYPDKDFGGFVAQGVQAVPTALYAAARARQALYNLGGIYVEDVEVNENTLVLKLIIDKEKRQVEITL